MAAADISAQIRAIQQASRGEEVRDSIVTALNAINNGAKGQSDIDNAINALDVASVGGTGKYIKSISESNGKISADEETADTQPTANSQKLITSGGVKSAIDSAVETLEQNFQGGVDAVYDAVVAKGSTPASKSLSDVVEGIENIETGIEPTGTITITQNGTTNVSSYAYADVKVPQPTGTINITQNGIVDVTNYESANVNVPSSGGGSEPIEHGSTWEEITFKGPMTGFQGQYIWEANGDVYYSYYVSGSTDYYLDKTTNQWVVKEWGDYSPGDGRKIWHKGNETYYSYGYGRYIYDKTTKSFLPKDWDFVIDQMYGKFIWTDGENIYYSRDKVHYIFDSVTGKWLKKTWYGLTNFGGRQVWTDGNNVYYSNGAAQYVLNKSTSRWSKKTWSGLTQIYGDFIWTDGTNIYHSNGSNQHILNGSTWTTKTWNGGVDPDRPETSYIYGSNIWTDGTDIYISSHDVHFILDKSTSTWVSINVNANIDMDYMWSDGTNVYYSRYSDQLVWDKSTKKFVTKTWNGLPNFWADHICVIGNIVKICDYTHADQRDGTKILNKATSTWADSQMIGTNIYDIDGQDVWSDGVDTYWSNGQTAQYIYDETLSSWIRKVFPIARYEFPIGRYVWSDGIHVYYSHGSSIQEVLNRETNRWDEKVWDGYTPSYGNYVWSDGTNIYYSDYDENYVFDSSTGTWSEKTFTGTPEYFTGSDIWTDGTNIYYSSDDFYILNNDTFSVVIFYGPLDISQDCVWKDGDNVYYSNGSKQLVLNKSTLTWNAKIWNGLTEFYGYDIWTDGENIYYSGGSDQYVLDKLTSTWNAKTWSGLDSSSGTEMWDDGEHIYTRSYTDEKYRQYRLSSTPEPDPTPTPEPSYKTGLLAFAPRVSYIEQGMGGVYNVNATNIDLAAEGCTETTDVTLADIHEGTIVKFMWIDDTESYWSNPIQPFTTIAQLESQLNSNPNMRTATVHNRTDSYVSGAFAIGAYSGEDYYFGFDESNGTINGAYWINPNEQAPNRFVMFIISQPEHTTQQEI